MMTPQAGEIVVQLVDSIRDEKLERFLDFCFNLSDEISLSSISKQQMLKEEAKAAAKKAGEALKERGFTGEETEEWIQDYYDSIEENSMCYVQSTQDLEVLINKNLADYELIKREVTCSTHCTLGGPTAVYYLKNEAYLKSRFKKMATTFDWIILEEANEFELEDPAFYKEGKLVCSICSHEKLGFLHLTEEEYKVFRSLRVPHDVQHINTTKDNEVQMEPIVIENMTYYPLETEMTEGSKGEVSNMQTEEVKRRKELVAHLKEYAYQEREKVVLWGWHQEDIPEEIGQIKTLKELWVLDYEVKELPKALEELTDLECLRITRNQVEELNFDISKLQKLKILDLSSMPLQAFPQEIIEIKGLEELYLSGEHMTEIPESIMKLKQLKILLIEGIDEDKLSPELADFINRLKPRAFEQLQEFN